MAPTHMFHLMNTDTTSVSEDLNMEYIGIVISGTSGSGKSTVARRLCMKHPTVRLIESVTTRNPRKDDAPGEYRYITGRDFARLESEDKLLVNVQYRGEHYGILIESLERILTEGKIPVMTVAPKGVREYETANSGKRYRFLTFFLDTSDKELDKRLASCDRWTGEDTNVQRGEDREYRALCAYDIRSDDAEKTANQIWQIWQARRSGKMPSDKASN